MLDDARKQKTNWLLPRYVLFGGAHHNSFSAPLRHINGRSKYVLILANFQQIVFRYS